MYFASCVLIGELSLIFLAQVIVMETDNMSLAGIWLILDLKYHHVQKTCVLSQETLVSWYATVSASDSKSRSYAVLVMVVGAVDCRCQGQGNTTLLTITHLIPV